MQLIEIPQAAGITGILTAAGMPANVVHAWFHAPRRQLGWLSPSEALMTIPGAGGPVLTLARADAVALLAEVDLPKHGGVEGS